jgi:anionic cell wall polymer biosynthesis LytR-Cps2A-Psr (LCP) family protein
MQTFTAAQALSFVRQRHGLPYGDLDRTHRQQAFLAAVTHKLRSNGILSNRGALHGLINVARKDVVIDDRLDPVNFASEASALTSGNITFYTLPIDGFVTTGGGLPRRPNAHSSRGARPAHCGPTPTRCASQPSPARRHATVDVDNAAGQAGIAAAISGSLAAQGYQPGAIGNSNPNRKAMLAVGSGGGAD